MGRLAELERRLADAPESVRQQAGVLADQIERLLAQSQDDAVWAEQIGPAYTATQVAKLLGVSRQAVGQRRGLLRLEQRDGRVAYPVFQFDGAAVLSGLSEVVVELTPAVATQWTIASWLTSPNAELDDLPPHEVLRRGERSRVLRAARGFAVALHR